MAKIDLNDYLEKLTEPEDRETVANRAYQRELFEQYVTKDGNFPEQRAQLLEDFRAGKELTGPKGLRRKLGAFDLEYFGRAYLAHYFVRPSPKFHGELDRIWREGVLKGMNPEVDAKRISRADGCRRAIEAPRGHAKSTTFTFKDDLHAAVYGYKHYIIILSDSSEQAEGFLVDIKTELEENAALKEDFGELEGKVWKSSVILLANGVKIEAIGSGKKIRGRRHKQWRPDLIQPGQIQPHTLEVAFQNPAIHNQLSKRQFLFRRQIHVAGRYRALGTHWKNRQPPVKIENCGLDIGEVKVSLLPAHNTNHADAFSKAVQLFDPASGNAKVMVIFTDGNTTTGAPPAPVATAAKAQGIIIYCIGLIGSDGLDISALNDWATDPDASHVAVTPDTADLEALFAQLAANISKPGATDIIINEAVNPDFVTLLFLKLKIPALQAFLSRRAYVTALL